LTDLNLRNSKGTIAVLEAISSFVHLVRLELCGFKLTDSTPVTVIYDGSNRPNFFAKLTNLTELILGDFFHLHIGLQPLKKLSTLHLWDYGRYVMDLMECDRDRFDLPLDTPAFTTLMTLHFSLSKDCGKFYDHITKMTNLTELDLSFNEWTKSSYEWISVLTLVDLRIGGYECKMSNHLLAGHTQLTSLNMLKNYTIGDESLTCLTNLQRLNIQEAGHVTGSGVVKLANSLTALDIGSCRALRDDSLKQLTSVRILYLRYNRFITNAALVHLTNLTLLGTNCISLLYLLTFYLLDFVL
jgi:Leucine-rich repeat (LRR) protein